MTTRVTITFLDVYGKRFSISFYVASTIVSPDDPVILGFITVANALLESVAIRVEISRAAAAAGALGSGPYNTVQDKLVMTCLDVENDAHNLQLPGVKETVLLSDKRALDLADPDVELLSLNIIDSYTGRGGQDLTGIEKGHRWSARRQTTR